MKTRLFKLAYLFLLISSSSFSQQGWWTWMHGSNSATLLPTPVYGTINVPAATNVPPPVYQAYEWTDNNGNFWLFGGMDANGNFYACMWMYNPTTNIWTWKKGPNGTNPFVVGVYGTKGVAAPANNPGGRLCGFTWVDNSGDLWMFGGYGSGASAAQGDLCDLWRYNIASNTWTWMNGPNTVWAAGVYGTLGVPAANNYPPHRGESNASWTDNAGNLWLFGGYRGSSGGSGNAWYNDLWKYDIALNQWAWMKGPNTTNNPGSYGTKGVPAATNLPSSREPFAKWKDINGNFWLFGAGTADVTGTGPYLARNDMWKYDVTTNNWTWMRGANTTNSPGAYGTQCVSSPNNDPSARWENKACWTDTCGNFWMFGGDGPSMGNSYRNDLWYYNVTSNEWMWVGGSNLVNNLGTNGTLGVAAATNRPRGRCGAVAFTHNNSDLYLFGGINQATGQSFNDLWRFVIDTNCVNMNCFTANPIANFNSPTSGCAPFSVTFNNTSTGSNAWSWNFGDGNTSTAQNPTNVYSNPGTYTVTLIATDGTTSDTLTMTNYITVYANAVATYTANKDTLCTGDSVLFTNTSVNSNASSWTFGDGGTSTQTNPSHTYTNPGTYTVTLIALNANGCHDTITSTVFVTGAQVAAGAPLNLTCIITSGIISASSTTPNVTYSWAGPGIVSGNNNDSATVNMPGTYTVTVTDPLSGCTNTSTVIVTSNTTIPNLTMGNPISLNCIITNGFVTATSTTAGVTYNWSGPGIVSGGSTSNPSVNMAGTYTVVVTDPSNGCTNTGTVAVTNNNAIPNLTAGPSITLACEPDTIMASSTTTGINYSWSGPGILSGANTPNPLVNTPGTYTVIVTDPTNGCTSTATIVVAGLPLPVAGVSPDVTIMQGDSTTLVATGGPSYNWIPATGLSCTNCVSPIAKPKETTTYCVIVTDTNGCSDTACVTVYVEIPCPNPNDLTIVPNAFSPNGDGINDDFCLQGWAACIENFQVIIYDRWGEKVFESVDPNFCWDGKYRGVKMDAQVFVYYIKATYTKSDVEIIRKGNISLLR